jgi:hypothetical protein
VILPNAMRLSPAAKQAMISKRTVQDGIRTITFDRFRYHAVVAIEY